MKLEWRLGELMRVKGVHSLSALQRSLSEAGFDISIAQLSRLRSQRPERVSLRLLEALTTALHCRLDELLSSEGAANQAAPPASPRAPAANASRSDASAKALPVNDDIEALLGPSPVPIPSRQDRQEP